MKMLFGCLDCRWREWPRGLDWDHVRGVKITTIAIMIANGRPWCEIEAEMAKCELVCANCHRIRTCERRIVAAGFDVMAVDACHGWGETLGQNEEREPLLPEPGG